MDNLQFLDTTGLEEDEIFKLQSFLDENSENLSFPWISKKDKYKKKRFKNTNAVKCNGTSTSECYGIPNNMDYGHHTPYIGVPYNQNQLPPIVSYGPTHYQHSPMYTNFHHPVQMMSSTNNGVHFMYAPNHMYNYAQVPVTFQNYSENAVYYPAQAVPELQFFNGASNGEISFYDEQPQANPQESVVINNTPVLSPENTDIPVKPEICIEQNDDRKDIPVTNVVKTDAPTITKNDDKRLKKSKKKNKMSPIKSNTEESSNADMDETAKNMSNSTSPVKEIVNSTERILAKETSLAEKKTDASSFVDPESHSVKDKGMNVTSESVWNRKPGASLFKVEAPMTNGGQVPAIVKTENGINGGSNDSIDPATYRLREYLVNYKINAKAVNFQPRGLINKSNYCYINAILQALLACPPLCNLLKGMSENLSSSCHGQSIPMIENMCEFFKEFSKTSEPTEFSSTKRNKKKLGTFDMNCGDPIEAVSFYTMLNGTRSDSFLVEGRQEDAEEFLGLLLNGLNDEMMSVIKTMKNKDEMDSFDAEMNQDSDDWKTMGPKKKGNITRKVQFDKTPISDIFGGLLCSKIHKTGDESTVNIQPFLTLQLNIEKANTICEALELLTVKNQVEGLTSSKTKQKVDAWQQVLIEQLPVVLVLHLKCFNYSYEGCTKIMKKIDFPIDLQIDSKILSGKTSSASEKQYKLFSVVYHEGKEASKGHYVADVFHKGYNTWLRFDDAKVKPVSEDDVLKPQGHKVPYLLFYKRTD